MNKAVTPIFIIIISCLISSFQCNNCKVKNINLDSTKSWFPLKGKTQIAFLDNLGNLTNYKLIVIDTTETAFNECGDTYNYQYIKTTLYLNNSFTDSIHFSLSSSGWLCMRAVSNNLPNVSMCNVFGQTREAIVAKKFNNYTVGNKNYQEVILLLHSQGYSNNIDSIFIANNIGYVGFKYANKKYTLQ